MERAAKRKDIVVIVDVLSFSSTVIRATSLGCSIYPCASHEDSHKLAHRIGAEVAVGRAEVPEKGRYSLSPYSFDGVKAGAKIVLCSPNGATCCRRSQGAPHILTGALVNAGAVGSVVSSLLDGTERAVTVIACGEREKSADGVDHLRVAIEDYLGAGAILSCLTFSKSPEASVCEAAFRECRPRLNELLWESVSGRELQSMGFGQDVAFCSNQDIIDVVPVLESDRFIAWR